MTFRMFQDTHPYLSDEENLQLLFNGFVLRVNTDVHAQTPIHPSGEYDLIDDLEHIMYPTILNCMKHLIGLHAELSSYNPAFTRFSWNEVNSFWQNSRVAQFGWSLFEMLASSACLNENYLADLSAIYAHRKLRIEHVKRLMSEIVAPSDSLEHDNVTLWNCWLIVSYIRHGVFNINGFRVNCGNLLETTDGRNHFRTILSRLANVDEHLSRFCQLYQTVCGESYDTVFRDSRKSEKHRKTKNVKKEEKFVTILRTFQIGPFNSWLNNFIYFGRLEKGGKQVTEEYVAKLLFRQQVLSDWLKQLDLYREYAEFVFGDVEKERLYVGAIDRHTDEWKVIEQVGLVDL
jgi:hypothetical protein